jgi:RHS repeat-associated protein
VHTYAYGNRLTDVGAASVTWDGLGGITEDHRGYTFDRNPDGSEGAITDPTGAQTHVIVRDAFGRPVETDDGSSPAPYVTVWGNPGGSWPLAGVDELGTPVLWVAAEGVLVGQLRGGSPVDAASGPDGSLLMHGDAFLSRPGAFGDDAVAHPTGPGATERYVYAGLQSLPGMPFALAQQRTYDPTAGRFVSADPVGLAGGDNRFAYANGDPLGFVDPVGWTAQESGAGDPDGGKRPTGAPRDNPEDVRRLPGDMRNPQKSDSGLECTSMGTCRVVDHAGDGKEGGKKQSSKKAKKEVDRSDGVVDEITVKGVRRTSIFAKALGALGSALAKAFTPDPNRDTEADSRSDQRVFQRRLEGMAASVPTPDLFDRGRTIVEVAIDREVRALGEAWENSGQALTESEAAKAVQALEKGFTSLRRGEDSAAAEQAMIAAGHALKGVAEGMLEANPGVQTVVSVMNVPADVGTLAEGAEAWPDTMAGVLSGDRERVEDAFAQAEKNRAASERLGETLVSVVDAAAAVRPRFCFTGDTLVWTPDGLVPIEEVREGDRVLARDELTGALAWRRVNGVYVAEGVELVEVTLVGTTGTTVLRTTLEHPFGGEDGWVTAERLGPGDRVRGAEGWLTVAAVRSLDQRETVYNLFVDEDHNYFVGEGGAWVHNGWGSASRGVTAGEAGRFADLDARAVVGDGLTPHHMPQAALNFTSRADGGA